MADTPLTVVSTYGAGGSSTRVRLLDWLEYCGVPATVADYVGTSDNGVRTLASRWPGVLRAEARLRVLASHPPADGSLILGRAASPFSNGRLEQRLLSRWHNSVYDFDDALFATPETTMSKLWSKRRVWTRAVATADTVIAGSEYLAERAACVSRNVVMIPSCVDPSRYRVKTDYDSPRPHPVAIWMGSPSTEQYLTRIADPLLRLHRSHGLRLTVISAGESSLGRLDPMVDRVAWSASTFASDLADADVGVMPLFDDEYSRGKCAYKLLQYGAAGLPVIGDPVGANRLALDRMGASAPTTADEWTQALTAVIDASVTARRQAGERARAAVVEHYSFGAWQAAWRAAVKLEAAPAGP